MFGLLLFLQLLDLLQYVAVLTLQRMRVFLEVLTTLPKAVHGDPAEVLPIPIFL
jgi:hypothetical protein